MQKYVFIKYNATYEDFFRSEKKKLKKIVDSTVRIEHVGSTAIPDLGGKGILDITVGVAKSKLVSTKQKLEKAGYEFRKKASYPERLFFRMDYPYKKKKRRIHIHLTNLDSQDWKEMIGFRDYLMAHPKAIKQYIKIKKDAVRKAKGNGEKYRKHKEQFIKEILRKSKILNNLE